MRCEILLDDGVSRKGLRMLRALVDAAPRVGLDPVVRPRRDFKGDCKFLLAYGIGCPTITSYMARMVAQKKHAIGMDMGYYGRFAGGGYPMRFTIDKPHPQALLKDYGPERWALTGRPLRDDYNSAGPVVVVGLGPKSRIQYKYRGLQWETQMIAWVRQNYPDRQIIYRPKVPRERIAFAKCDWTSTIEDVLKGASLAVIHHSNVAVDACIAGIPVICSDGAAVSLYGRGAHPSPEERLQFLQNLAWWQWRPEEALQCWQFLLKVLSSM